MKDISNLPDDLEKLKKKIEEKKSLILKNIGVVTSNYFQDRITQNVDIEGKPFKKRAIEFSNQVNRKILIQKGNLRRSIKAKKIDENNVRIGTDKPYAKINNEGGTIPITDEIRGFFREKMRKSRNKSDRQKWAILANKKTPIKIPKREFIGVSDELKKIVDNEVVTALSDIK